jgi:hypothetical protein
MHLPICLRWLGCSTALMISVDLLSKGAIIVRCFQLKQILRAKAIGSSNTRAVSQNAHQTLA